MGYRQMRERVFKMLRPDFHILGSHRRGFAFEARDPSIYPPDEMGLTRLKARGELIVHWMPDTAQQAGFSIGDSDLSLHEYSTIYAEDFAHLVADTIRAAHYHWRLKYSWSSLNFIARDHEDSTKAWELLLTRCGIDCRNLDKIIPRQNRIEVQRTLLMIEDGNHTLYLIDGGTRCALLCFITS